MKDETQQSTLLVRHCLKCRGQFTGDLKTCPSDGSQLRLPEDDLLLGTTFADRYEIISVLGYGGMSVVYKARHKLMDRAVAIKVLHSDLIQDTLAVQRFQQESKAAASLTHQNIVTVYDFGILPDGQAFFVMDCLEGPTLSSVLEQEHHLPFERAINIFKQVCDGLEAAHRKGIIHRDLKPDNIVLMPQEDGSDLVKIVDFGIAKIMPQPGYLSQQLTQAGEVFGSPLYMSPEQCTRSPLDSRTDIYSLGCVMYETLTGAPPIHGENFLETMHKHAYDVPRTFAQVVPALPIPKEMEATVMKCLEKDPAHRFQTVSDVKQAFSPTAVTGTTTGPLPPVPTPPLSVPTPPTKTNVSKVRKLLFKYLPFLALIILGLFTWRFATWTGPEEDQGTNLDKGVWQWLMWQAQQAKTSDDERKAIYYIGQAQQQTSKFHDNQSRLLKTLDEKRDIYSYFKRFDDIEKLERQYDVILKLKYKEFADRITAKLDEWTHGPNEGVSRSAMKLDAEANTDRFTHILRELGLHGLKSEEEYLLKRCISVYENLLGKDSARVADYKALLAELFLEQQRTENVRQYLLSVHQIRAKCYGEESISSIRALLKLGQFDRDQSNFKLAKEELPKALKLATKLQKAHNNPANRELLAECLNSYADYLKQLGDQERSKQFYLQAQELSP